MLFADITLSTLRLNILFPMEVGLHAKVHCGLDDDSYTL